jgi:hypothetical protein
MAHLPVNHPARPFVRFVAGVIGLYILAFGVTGFVLSRGESFFAQEDVWALGLRTNPAFSVLSILAGAALLGAALVGRNLDHFVNLTGGVVFVVAGVIMMALMRTDANFLNFAMPNVIVSLIIGLLLLYAGLYTKTGTPELAEAEDKFRHSEIGEEPVRRQPGARAIDGD